MSSSKAYPGSQPQSPPANANGGASLGNSRSETMPAAVGSSSTADGKKKKRHRAGRKRRNRRQSFAAIQDETDNTEVEGPRPSLLPAINTRSEARESLYRIGRANRSNTSLESEALLDHRDTSALMGRRRSVQPNSAGAQSVAMSPFSRVPGVKVSRINPFSSSSRTRLNKVDNLAESDEDEDTNERTHLMASSFRNRASTPRNYGLSANSPVGRGPFGSELRHPSQASSRSSRRRAGPERSKSYRDDDFDINNPPSVPNSPHLGGAHYDDLLLAGEDVNRGRSPDSQRVGDALIDIDGGDLLSASPTSSADGPEAMKRRMTMARAEADVCFPQEIMSEIADEDYRRETDRASYRARRRHRRVWPDLGVLEDWATEEKEERTIGDVRTRKVSEPLLVAGRLRPRQVAWHRDQEDAPYRFTYFNEEFQNTIHSQTIAELLQPGQDFKDLFIPEPPLLSDESSDEDEDIPPMPLNVPHEGKDGKVPAASLRSPTPSDAPTRTSTRNTSQAPSQRQSDQKRDMSGQTTGRNTPVPLVHSGPKPKRYGPRPVFWLDVLEPTDSEMKVLSKAFGIHPLTAEDIMMQEAREKVELFRHYYFVNYRSFEQDTNSEDYMEPVNMYVVVFREGVVSFHFSQTPHPANVRRRIRQLSDYLFLTTDWISYAIIDDVTDAYAPLIQRIEEEVDDIDEAILALHAAHENRDEQKAKDPNYDEKQSEAGDKISGDDGSHMLRRVGETRKKVMSLYRLLGNKADVIKGFAKRCNEQWEIAPRSEIGLYLGDIQDHIVTMTGNLSHYENLLSRAHSNYLAQINIRMNKRAEQTNDVLGKLTVLGTIVLPMNIVTGLWGMNCLVPGQDVESLTWFWCLTGGLLVFGLTCYLIAKRLYGIV